MSATVPPAAATQTPTKPAVTTNVLQPVAANTSILMVPPEMGSSITIGTAAIGPGLADGSTVTGFEGGEVYLSANVTQAIPAGSPVTFG